MLFLCLFLLLGQGGFTPPKPDLSFEKNMNSEAFDKTKTFVVTGKFESDEEKKLLELAQTYYESLITEDYTKAYELMCQDFKNAMTFKKFSNQTRLGIAKVTFHGVTPVGDKCRKVLIRVLGESADGSMGKIEINDNLTFSQENEALRIFKNPFANAMGLIPNNAKYTDPCVEPKQSAAK